MASRFAASHLRFFFASFFPVLMASSGEPTREMLSSIAAQLMILYDEAMKEQRPDVAEAYARALNVVRNETPGVRITFDGPPPTLRQIPRIGFPDELVSRLAPPHRPKSCS
jgi:hypothetical protein